MTTAIAELSRRPTRHVQRAAAPDAEPEDLAACLAGPNGHDLIVEMAHDLRSPLTSIVFLAEALQNELGSKLNDSQRRQLGLINSAALCLCATASDVVELARGGERLVGREPTPFSTCEIFGSVRGMILPIVEEKGIELQLVHPVPERRVGHPRALSRVLLNLCTNAVKFTEAGFVELAARPVGPTRLEFSVRDTGPSLEPAAIQALYQPFRKAPLGLRHYFSSSGLGLAICRKLLKSMNSELDVETRAGWGTRFFFELELPPASGR